MTADADTLPTREQVVADVAEAVARGVAQRAALEAQSPRAAAEAAWYPGHRLGTVEAIEAEIIRRRAARHTSGQSAA